MSLRMTVTTDFGSEVEIMALLHTCKEKWTKTAKNTFWSSIYSTAIENRGQIQRCCQNCKQKLDNRCFYTCTVKYNQKSTKYIFRKSMSLRTTVITDFKLEVEIMQFLHMRKPKNCCKSFSIVKIFDFYSKSGSLNQVGSSVVRIQKLLFLCMCNKNIAKTNYKKLSYRLETWRQQRISF